MSFFQPVREWHIPRLALNASIDEMSSDGRSGNEGVALWLGTRQNEIAQIRAVVTLRGTDVTRKPDLLVIGSDSMNNVTDLAIEHRLCMVCQIHSHGKYFGTNLSPTDHRYGVRIPFFLSVVAPDYGLRRGTTIADCGIHIFKPDSGFIRLSAQDVLRSIVLTDAADVPVIAVGD